MEVINETLDKNIPPIIIVCYNNYKYVENTVKQIFKINEDYFRATRILNADFISKKNTNASS